LWDRDGGGINDTGTGGLDPFLEEEFRGHGIPTNYKTLGIHTSNNAV